MEFIKNQKFGFYAYVVVAFLAIVSLIIYISNVSNVYYEDMNTNVVILLILAIGSIVVSLVVSKVLKGVLSDVLRVVSSILIVVSLSIFVGMRVESFGYVFGSNLELGNQVAFDAAGQAVLCIVLLVVTWILDIIAAFLPVGKKAN